MNWMIFCVRKGFTHKNNDAKSRAASRRCCPVFFVELSKNENPPSRTNPVPPSFFQKFKYPIVKIPNLVFLPILLLLFCKKNEPHRAELALASPVSEPQILSERFPAPAGFARETVPPNSFAAWLRRLPLKPPGAQVRLFNGELKYFQDAVAAVAEMDTGNKDLQQCADAAIRLWAEYLFSQKKYAAIHFNLTNGFRVDFEKWAAGHRVQVAGNKTWWAKTQPPSNSYATFRAYLDFVFRYAGSLSLSQELPEAPLSELEIGDIFIQGGSPGHVVVVLDRVKNPKTGAVRFLIGQSFMPAQDFHVLKNTENPALGAWFEIPGSDRFKTPDWSFSPVVLRRFRE